jgi:hypothetical protein
MKNSHLLKLRFLNPSGEWTGGVLAGFCFGMFVMAAILSPEHHVTLPWVWFQAGSGIIIGILLARDAQHKRFQKNVADEKHDVF